MGMLGGKVAVVTGGSSGIGLAIAEALSGEGARTVVVGRREAVVQEAARAVGPDAIGIPADVTRMEDLDRVFGQVKAQLGALDILVCSAGGTGGGTLETCTEEGYDAIMDLNVKSIFFTAQKALPLMRQGSSIILIGSVADTITLPGGGLYSASKAALLGFARSWATDLAPRGIRVNVLSPGVTETPLLERLQSTPQAMDAFDSMMANRTAMKRRGRAEEVASVAVFLASDKASYMTGGVLYADGGMHNW